MAARSSDQASEASRRDRILESAVQEFSAKGFAGVRIDEVAKRAGVNKALIYYYFESKEALYDAVVALLIERSQPFWTSLNEVSVREWLTEKWAWDGGNTKSPWLRLMAMEGLADEGPGTAALEAERSASLRQSVRILTKSQARGELDPELDTELLALMLIVWSLGPRILPHITRMVTGMAPDDPHFGERLGRFNEALADHLRPIPDGAG